MNKIIIPINGMDSKKSSEDLLPGGTYYYLVSFKNGTSKTGWVYLSR